MAKELNVLGTKLKPCCLDPITGWARDGYCGYFPDDAGLHLVCTEITQEFLDFSKERGNDLSTPQSGGFPGLTPGDKWCVCLIRVIEAFNAGIKVKVDLAATSIHVREVVPIEFLQQMANA